MVIRDVIKFSTMPLLTQSPVWHWCHACAGCSHFNKMNQETNRVNIFLVRVESPAEFLMYVGLFDEIIELCKTGDNEFE